MGFSGLFRISVSCHIFHICSPQAQKEPEKGGEERKGEGVFIGATATKTDRGGEERRRKTEDIGG